MSASAPPDDIEAWRKEMDERLRRRDGWLALCGLHWLSQGSHLAGSESACDVPLPAPAPPRLGRFDRRGREVYFLPEPGLERTIEGTPPEGRPLQPEGAAHPDFLRIGDITVLLIEREGALALRVWDNSRRERTAFPGRAWYPVRPEYRLPARFTPSPPGRTIAVPNQLGGLTQEPDLGAATFALPDKPASLRAVPRDDGRLWFLFTDTTNGTATYAAGRFLVAEPPRDGTLILDFNRAYNPPCAFTPFATCPLPPDANRLPSPVEAGERLRSEG